MGIKDPAARLTGWKGIADYLGVEKSTAQRWQKERNLPVHRLPGGKGGSVFAVVAEIDSWLTSRLPEPPQQDPEEIEPAPETGTLTVRSVPGTIHRWTAPTIGAAVALVIAASIRSASAKGDDAWFIPLTSLMYASLYAISIWLETAYAEPSQRFDRAAVLVFSFIFLTSLAALTLDRFLVGSGRAGGLGVALFIFLGAGVLQWIAVRRFLPEEAVVKAKFQSHTAQSAHLKNTGYFLLLVIFFWLPPFHYAITAERQIRLGQPQALEQLLSGKLLPLFAGTLYLNPFLLWGILILMFLISIPMGSRLLDNLESHPGRNRYSNLFYGRALVYFALSIVCLAWYTHATSRITESLVNLRTTN